MASQNYQPCSLWDFLRDEVCGQYLWRKEQRHFANCYACYYNDIEIGFIPIQHLSTDVEWKTWWEAAYKRHNNDLTLKDLMNEIMDRHKRFVK